MRVFVLLVAAVISVNADISAQSAEATAAAKRLALIEADIAAAKARLDVIELEMDGLNERVPGRGAFIDCNTANYVQTLPTDGYLPFLVNCEKIEPYLEGFKITVNLGNPHSVRFTHVTGVIGHGEKSWDAWDKKNQVPLNATGEIAPSSWNHIQVTINPVAAKDVRSIWLEFSPDTASLAR